MGACGALFLPPCCPGGALPITPTALCVPIRSSPCASLVEHEGDGDGWCQAGSSLSGGDTDTAVGGTPARDGRPARSADSPGPGTSAPRQLPAPCPGPAGSAGAAVPHREPFRGFPALRGARSPSAGPASPEQRCGAEEGEGAGKTLRAGRAQVPGWVLPPLSSPFQSAPFKSSRREGLLPERKTRPAAAPSGLLPQ